jgi:hypothetical protein
VCCRSGTSQRGAKIDDAKEIEVAHDTHTPTHTQHTQHTHTHTHGHDLLLTNILDYFVFLKNRLTDTYFIPFKQFFIIIILIIIIIYMCVTYITLTLSLTHTHTHICYIHDTHAQPMQSRMSSCVLKGLGSVQVFMRLQLSRN